MLSFYSKLTNAQQLALSGVASLLFAAIVTTIAATWQYYTSQGQLNVQALFVFAIGALGTALTTAAYHYIPTHWREDMQALADTNDQLRAQVDRQQTITRDAINKNVAIATSQVPTPSIVIHAQQVLTAAPTDVSALETARVPVPQVADMATQVVPVPQVPFPPPLNITAKPEDVATAVLSAFPDVAFQSTMPEMPIVPTPDYSGFHWGDTEDIPTVAVP